MSYLIHYDAVALFLNAVAAYIFCARKNLRDGPSLRFIVLLAAASASSLFGLLDSLAANAGMGRAGLLALHAAHMLGLNAVPAAAAWYILSVTRSWPRGRASRLLFFLPAAASLLLTLSSPWSGLAFGAEAGRAFVGGPALPLLYAQSLWYAAWAFGASLRRRASLSASARLLFPAVLALPILAIIVGSFFPQVPLESFAISVSLLLILFTLQDAGTLIDRATGLFNAKAFERFVETLFQAGNPFRLLLVRASNIQSLKHRLSPAALDRLSAHAGASLLSLIGGQGRVFYLEEGSFALLIEGKGGSQTLLGIGEGLSGEWGVGDGSAIFRPRTCLIHCPEEASDILDIQDCLEQLELRRPQADESGVLGPLDLGVLGVRREAEIEGAILEAIASNRVGVLWQALVSTESGRATQADTQICLEAQDGELIAQRDLLRVSERSGSAHRLGFLALKTICAAYAANDMAAKGLERVQVRLSAFQCLRSDLPQQVLAITEALGLEPSRLCLEITEAAAIHSPEAASRNMRLLCAQGVAFALDDYGSGYTDLGYILDMPFDLIKLDKAVIKAGFASARGRAVLEGTIALLRRLNRRIAAEGVETEEQARVLSEAGVDLLQGFRFGKPAETEDFIKGLL